MDENPFIPFRPALGSKFINRVDEEHQIFDNILQGNNTSIIGHPRIGKTSLLQKIATSFPKSYQNNNIIVVYINIELMSEDDTPKNFWNRICIKVIEQNKEFEFALEKFTLSNEYTYHDLFESFESLGKSNKRVVVLIDEFEKYLDKKGIANSDFIDPIRAISKDSGGLCFIIASRQPLTEISNKLPTSGSLLDVYEIMLRGFDQKTITDWLLAEGLSPDSISEIKLIGDSHPALLQLAGHVLWPARNEAEKIKTQYRENFLALAGRYFNEVWGYLNEKSQLALVLIVLNDFKGNIGNKSFDIESIYSKLLWLTQELIDLENLGVLEKSNSGARIGSVAFKTWLIRAKIADAAVGDITINNWLHSKEFKIKPGIVTQEELEFIWNVIKVCSPFAADIAKGLLLPK